MQCGDRIGELAGVSGRRFEQVECQSLGAAAANGRQARQFADDTLERLGIACLHVSQSCLAMNFA
jgi:hypothetical protein